MGKNFDLPRVCQNCAARNGFCWPRVLIRLGLQAGKEEPEACSTKTFDGGCAGAQPRPAIACSE
jgi:hypothetical protein